jgi:hypothetical protein
MDRGANDIQQETTMKKCARTPWVSCQYSREPAYTEAPEPVAIPTAKRCQAASCDLDADLGTEAGRQCLAQTTRR